MFKTPGKAFPAKEIFFRGFKTLMSRDMPLNVRLVKEVGVGLEVMRDENERFNGKEIAQVIRKVIVEENGKGIRNMAKGFTEKIRRKGDEEIDGAVEELKSSKNSFDEVAAHEWLVDKQ
ncbi:hypothetical protein HYC85_000252 [Camellia sinensis]|uniref:Uncharacterized protein n=1 Tax=Camellia sinensis TaxID=4442 RepID=A0A7J7I1V9_CAMSI|nr:hypothetical protein HYC85_000252 [Camellia sinensis]